MNKLKMRFGNLLAGIALLFATVDMNATCMHYLFQSKPPKSAEKLRRF